MHFISDRSFRSKIMALVIVSIAMTVVLVMFIVLLMYSRLSDDSARIISQHMRSLYSDFVAESSKEIAVNVRLQVEQITHELKIFAGAAQSLIDMGQEAESIGRELQRHSFYKNNFVYNSQQNWSNIEKGDADISISVWGYQHDASGQIDAATRAYADRLVSLKPLMRSMGEHGVKKGWLYVVGPKSAPLMMMYPWAQMPAIFDEKYPGHNTSNWWDFFFPNMVEGWEKWLTHNPGLLTDGSSLTTITPFYEDAGGTGVMFTFFYPLWNARRDANVGAVAIDVNVANLAGIVQNAKLGNEGFSFVLTSDGDILGLSDKHGQELGVRPKEGSAVGVNTWTINIFSSDIPSLANLKLPGEHEDFKFYDLSDNDAGFYLALRAYAKVFRWNGETIAPVRFFVGVIVPKSEVSFIQNAIQKEIASASWTSIAFSILAAVVISAAGITLSVLVASYGTRQIRILMERAKSLAQGDFQSRVQVISRDELGQLAQVFNAMAVDLSDSRRQIQEHTENLERLVEQRTRELEKANKLLEDLSLTDSLTGLRNRRHFDESLVLLWNVAQREGQRLSLLLFDVDNFKNYNDHYGHQHGDHCLKRIADAVRRCARRSVDQVCRYGGEEFAVLLLGDREAAVRLGENIRQAVENERMPHAHGASPVVTISLGCTSVVDFVSDSPEQLVARADVALYQSKRDGRNRLTVL